MSAKVAGGMGSSCKSEEQVIEATTKNPKTRLLNAFPEGNLFSIVIKSLAALSAMVSGINFLLLNAAGPEF